MPNVADEAAGPALVYRLSWELGGLRQGFAAAGSVALAAECAPLFTLTWQLRRCGAHPSFVRLMT